MGEFLILVGTFQYVKVFAVLASVGIILGAAYLLWMYQRTMFQQANEKWLVAQGPERAGDRHAGAAGGHGGLDRPLPAHLPEHDRRPAAEHHLARCIRTWPSTATACCNCASALFGGN